MNSLHAGPKTEQEVRGEYEIELLDCARNGDIDRCVQLLALGAGVDATDTSEMTPLHHASFFGYDNIVKLLLDSGADITLVDEVDRTALIWAAAGDHLSVCRLLIEAGVSAAAATPDGATPLQSAVINRNLPLVQYLMACGAKSSYAPENPNPDYLTPYQWAVKQKRLEFVEFMQQAGAEDPGQRTADGRTLIQLAGKGAVAAYLRSQATQRTVEDGVGEVAAGPSSARNPMAGPL